MGLLMHSSLFIWFLTDGGLLIGTNSGDPSDLPCLKSFCYVDTQKSLALKEKPQEYVFLAGQMNEKIQDVSKAKQI